MTFVHNVYNSFMVLSFNYETIFIAMLIFLIKFYKPVVFRIIRTIFLGAEVYDHYLSGMMRSLNFAYLIPLRTRSTVIREI